MTPHTDEQVAETLQWLRTTMESGTDFLVDQAPLYAEELLRYGVVANAVWLCVGLIVLAMCVAAWVAYALACKRYLFSSFDDEMFFITLALLSFAAGIYGVAQVATSADTLIQINTAPRVYIMEHLKP